MLKRVMHNLVSHPAIYDLVQIAAGASVVRRKLRALIPRPPAGSTVLDIGAGTGLYRNLWASDARYVCVDLDPIKLRGFRRRFDDFAVQADAAILPFENDSVDIAVCTLMSHHLDDHAFDAMLGQVRRVLKPSGCFVYADPVWQPARAVGRLLWKYDQGSHPRTIDQLQSAIASRLRIERWIDFAYLHRYAACVATKA